MGRVNGAWVRHRRLSLAPLRAERINGKLASDEVNPVVGVQCQTCRNTPLNRREQPMDTGFGATQLYSACRLTITHYYEPNDHTPPPCFGTGFLVEFPNGDNRLGLVTNRHLTDIPWHKPECEGTTIKSVKIEWWQSDKLRLECTIADPKPLYHDDQSIDIAIIPFGPEMDPKTLGTLYDNIENIVPHLNADRLEFKHGLSWEYLLKCERLWPQLRPGELVIFPGYPIWYDILQTRPVLRSGMIASDPQTDYRRHEGEPTNHDGNQQILFDAFSTSGNSGSPVFVAQRGLAPLELKIKLSQEDSLPQQAAKMEFSQYHEAFLIGINAGHFNEHANDHAGLSRMHKLSAIMDILRANESDTNPSARNISIFIRARKSDTPGAAPTTPGD
jgi:hypothetical protein